MNCIQYLNIINCSWIHTIFYSFSSKHHTIWLIYKENILIFMIHSILFTKVNQILNVLHLINLKYY